jgi:hypothetical protein
MKKCLHFLQNTNAGGERRAKRASVLAVRSSAVLDAVRTRDSALDHVK